MDKESININTNEKNKISFILKNKNDNNNNDLKMNVYILKMGIFRIKIDDVLPKEGTAEERRKRFKVIFKNLINFIFKILFFFALIKKQILTEVAHFYLNVDE